MTHQQHQLQQQQQQQQQQQHHNQQQQQQQEQLQQSHLALGELSDFGLDPLDAASLSPTLLQDVSLSAASPLNSTLYNGNTSGAGSSNGIGSGSIGYFPTDMSHSLSLNVVSEQVLLQEAVAQNELLYEMTPNSNAMWSDISSAIIHTKHEPFSLDDDYIFPNDKAEIQAADLSELNGDFLDVIGNIEDFLPQTTVSQSVNFLLSPQTQGQDALVAPPMELLQQQQQHQSQQQLQVGSLPQLQTLLTLTQQQQQSNSSSTSPYEIYHSTPQKPQQQQLSASFSPGSQASQSPLTPPPPPHANRPQYQMVKSRNMQELIKKGFPMSSPPERSILSQSAALSPGGSSGFGSSVSGNSTTTSNQTTGSAVRKSFGYQSAVENSQLSRLSSSAPTHLGLEHIWMRREPRQHLLSTGSLAEAESFSSLSTGSVLSPDGIDFSQDDEDDNSSENSDNYDDFSSDNGLSGDEDETRTSTPNHLSSSKGKERFFWQYNVQAKGPKGKRLVFQSKLEDPHVLNEVTDPVFSPTCSVRGIKVYKVS